VLSFVKRCSYVLGNHLKMAGKNGEEKKTKKDGSIYDSVPPLLRGEKKRLEAKSED